MTDTPEILQLKVTLKGMSPSVWRRVLVPTSFTLRELHGVLQVAMGWEGYHLYLFKLRAVNYGPIELHAASPKLVLSSLQLHKNERFSYVYDMGDYWDHEVRVEGLGPADPKQSYPVCIGGSKPCPPEDSGGVEGYLARVDEAYSPEAWRDIDTMASFKDMIQAICDSGRLPSDDDFYELENARERMQARLPYLKDRFSRKDVNDLFKAGRHQELQHQNTEVIFDLGGF